MPYDGIFAAAIVHELQTTVVGSRIDKIFQPAPYTLLLHCRVPGESHKLILSAHPRHARVHLTSSRPANPLQAPVFCMTLRKHLDPGRVVKVEQQGLDRVITFHIDGFDDVGRPARRLLIAELTGRNSNIVLVDKPSGRIIDALKRVSGRTNLYRALLPGEAYVPPPSGDKVDPRHFTRAALQQKIEKATSPESDGAKASKALPALFDGVSPFAARELARRATGEGSPTARVAQALYDLCRDIDETRFSPTMRQNDDGEPTDVWAFQPKQWRAGPHVAVEQANEAADVYYTHDLTRQAVADKQRVLRRGVNTARKRLARKAKALQKDLQNAAKADEYRIYGELLTANMHLVGRGSETEVPNYYAEGKLITIPLDPTLGPAANAQRYFRRYAKLKTALTVVQEQLDETEADIAWLEQAGVHLQMAATPAQLDEIGRELVASGMMPRNVRSALQEGGARRRRSRRRKTRRQAPAPPMEAIIGDGVRVFIGGNSRQNERISFRLARPDDIWLHAKDIAGAHVLLPRNQFGSSAQEQPPERLIAEAAAIAAYFSKGRQSGNVPVDWTLAKHVRKPRGARPGMAIYDNHRTVYVTPDEATITRQLARAKE